MGPIRAVRMGGVEPLRAHGEEPILDLRTRVESSGEIRDLLTGDVDLALDALWERLPG